MTTEVETRCSAKIKSWWALDCQVRSSPKDAKSDRSRAGGMVKTVSWQCCLGGRTQHCFSVQCLVMVEVDADKPRGERCHLTMGFGNLAPCSLLKALEENYI